MWNFVIISCFWLTFLRNGSSKAHEATVTYFDFYFELKLTKYPGLDVAATTQHERYLKTIDGGGDGGERDWSPRRDWNSSEDQQKTESSDMMDTK